MLPRMPKGKAESARANSLEFGIHATGSGAALPCVRGWRRNDIAALEPHDAALYTHDRRDTHTHDTNDKTTHTHTPAAEQRERAPAMHPCGELLPHAYYNKTFALGAPAKDECPARRLQAPTSPLARRPDATCGELCRE